VRAETLPGTPPLSEVCHTLGVAAQAVGCVALRQVLGCGYRCSQQHHSGLPVNCYSGLLRVQERGGCAQWAGGCAGGSSSPPVAPL
jgi:hypothetical protein